MMINRGITMKVYIAVDMDGVSGTVSMQESAPWGRDYERCRRWMTMDVNAAVEGALAGGATEVVCHDLHSRTTNLLWEEMHPQAYLIKGGQGGSRHLFQGLDSSYDALFLVGMHVRAGWGRGVCSHTVLGNDLFLDVRINGDDIGEGGIAAALAGHYGVPLALVTGDDLTAEEVKYWQPEVESAVVKYAIDRFTARCPPQQKALETIRQAAERAVCKAPNLTPFTYSPPVKLEIACSTPVIAQRLAYMPGSEWDGHRTVSYVGEDFLETYRAFQTLIFVAYSTRYTVDRGVQGA